MILAIVELEDERFLKKIKIDLLALINDLPIRLFLHFVMITILSIEIQFHRTTSYKLRQLFLKISNHLKKQYKKYLLHIKKEQRSKQLLLLLTSIAIYLKQTGKNSNALIKMMRVVNRTFSFIHNMVISRSRLIKQASQTIF